MNEKTYSPFKYRQHQAILGFTALDQRLQTLDQRLVLLGHLDCRRTSYMTDVQVQREQDLALALEQLVEEALLC